MQVEDYRTGKGIQDRWMTTGKVREYRTVGGLQDR